MLLAVRPPAKSKTPPTMSVPLKLVKQFTHSKALDEETPEPSGCHAPLTSLATFRQGVPPACVNMPHACRIGRPNAPPERPKPVRANTGALNPGFELVNPPATGAQLASTPPGPMKP